jgi:ABC-type polysaccharide/polyol phosphate transport system ATPase subunit
MILARVTNLSVAYPRLIRAAAADVTAVDEGRAAAPAVRPEAIQDITFDVADGDRLGVLGLNGSGKTTLLQAFSGILTPTSGSVKLAYRPVNLINFGFGLVDFATGYENILLRGLALGHSRAEMLDVREEVCRFSGLGDAIHERVYRYSSGMKMRLAFSIVTAISPEILVLDEWLSAGDRAFQERSKERMAALTRSAGALIMATHSERIIQSNCNRALLLDQGRLVFDGSTEAALLAYKALSP